MKKTRLAWPAGLALLSASAMVQADFSANISVTSNYIWRGVTQTDNKAAIQGGVDWTHDSGFYLGTWASNVDFGAAVEQSVSAEWDLYGGFANSIGDLGYDVGYVYYAYPDSGNTDFSEIYGSLSWKWFSAGLNYTVSRAKAYSPLFQTGDLYGYLGAGIDLPMGFSAGLTVGHYWFDKNKKQEAGGEKLDYTHYLVEIGKSAGDFGDVTLSFSRAEDTAANAFDDKTRVFVSWSKTFE